LTFVALRIATPTASNRDVLATQRGHNALNLSDFFFNLEFLIFMPFHIVMFCSAETVATLCLCCQTSQGTEKEHTYQGKVMTIQTRESIVDLFVARIAVDLPQT
jgi:hypothetical protein